MYKYRCGLHLYGVTRFVNEKFKSEGDFIPVEISAIMGPMALFAFGNIFSSFS